jgi:hypothetical protein
MFIMFTWMSWQRTGIQLVDWKSNTTPAKKIYNTGRFTASAEEPNLSSDALNWRLL